MREKTKNLIAEALVIEVTDVNEDAKLRDDLGLQDSDLAEIVGALGSNFTTEILPDEIAKCQTVGEFLNLVEQHGPEELWRAWKPHWYNFQR